MSWRQNATSLRAPDRLQRWSRISAKTDSHTALSAARIRPGWAAGATGQEGLQARRHRSLKRLMTRRCTVSIIVRKLPVGARVVPVRCAKFRSAKAPSHPRGTFGIQLSLLSIERNSTDGEFSLLSSSSRVGLLKLCPELTHGVGRELSAVAGAAGKVGPEAGPGVASCASQTRRRSTAAAGLVMAASSLGTASTDDWSMGASAAMANAMCPSVRKLEAFRREATKGGGGLD